MTDLQIEKLPEAAKRELSSFYEYLVYKYIKNINDIRKTNDETESDLAAFHKLKELRRKINPVIDKSLDIDQLCNEVNRDIF